MFSRPGKPGLGGDHVDARACAVLRRARCCALRTCSLGQQLAIGSAPTAAGVRVVVRLSDGSLVVAVAVAVHAA
jgi:hypothetical protein